MRKADRSESPPIQPPICPLPLRTHRLSHPSLGVSRLQYHNEELYANLYTMHSWSGIVVVTLFFANYVGGFFNFFAGMTPQWVRAGQGYVPCERFFLPTYLRCLFSP